MSKVDIVITVKNSRVNQLANLVNGAVTKSNLKVGRTIRDYARSIAPVDTSAMKSGLYVSTPEDSDYEECRINAGILRPKVPPEAEERPRARFGVNVGSVMPYIFFVEYGTVNQEAQPFMHQAADTVERTYLDIAVKELNSVLNG